MGIGYVLNCFPPTNKNGETVKTVSAICKHENVHIDVSEHWFQNNAYKTTTRRRPIFKLLQTNQPIQAEGLLDDPVLLPQAGHRPRGSAPGHSDAPPASPAAGGTADGRATVARKKSEGG